MLTVKYISEFGFELVIPAIEVSTRGREYPAVAQGLAANVSDEFRPNFIIDCKRGPTETETFRDGQVYVMNDNGKTVASYDLRYAPQAQAARNADVAKSYVGGVLGGTIQNAKMGGL
jgi:hypothetical protein